MYRLESVYSKKAFDHFKLGQINLSPFKESSADIVAAGAWKVDNWDDLRTAFSFLTLMNKCHTLYSRGQKGEYSRCLPVLFRNAWLYNAAWLPIGPGNRGYYHDALLRLQPAVLQAAVATGMPRTQILEHVPAATAAILQHYELWPTSYVDVTRSLPIAVTFAEEDTSTTGYVYVFALPDLRGSMTSDIDDHMTIARLDAVCPPEAKRPHHQEGYLVSRFPEPVSGQAYGSPAWNNWMQRSDLNHRLVAYFKLTLDGGRLPGGPHVPRQFLLPSDDTFGTQLNNGLSAQIAELVENCPTP